MKESEAKVVSLGEEMAEKEDTLYRQLMECADVSPYTVL